MSDAMYDKLTCKHEAVTRYCFNVGIALYMVAHQRWIIFADGGPTIKQHVNISLSAHRVPRTSSITAIGSRTFSVAAYRLWNELPLEIRSQISFRKILKVYVFFWSSFTDLNLQWSGWPDDKRKRFWSYESDYDYAHHASELGSPRIYAL